MFWPYVIRLLAWICYGHRVILPTAAGTGGEEQVRGEINHEDEEEESDAEMRGSGAVGAMEEGIGDGEIEILVGGDEARGDQDGDQDGGL